ncbi:MAG TPA: amidase [Trueperaceae bacterium]|nr:amidase [Trueperaceae bacterium]
MLDEHYAFMSLTDQAALIRTGELSPVALVELYLDRIAKYNDRINAFITVAADSALARARLAEQEIKAGDYRGPLHGIPVGVKDQMQINGMRVTGGSKIYADAIGTRDATVIARLRAAGAVLLGTLNTHEFHMGPTVNFPYGTPRNPWNLERNPGGSSSGSATALAAGLVSAALGGDTGGSIRGPATACGVVGLKPTWSRVSRDGVFPLGWTLDCVGPLARTVPDAAAVLQVIAGYDPLDATSSRKAVPDYGQALTDTSLKGLRIGVVKEMYSDDITGPDALAAVKGALDFLEAKGAILSAVSLPLMRETRFVSPALTKPEAASYHRRNLLERYLDFDYNTRVSSMVGAILPAGLASRAQRARVVIGQQVLDALEDVDVLVGAGSAGGAVPIVPRPPIKTKQEALEKIYGVGKAAGQYTRVFSLAGTPAMVVPAGFDHEGLPLSLHIAGGLFDEATVLRVGNAFQRETNWHGRRPPLA